MTRQRWLWAAMFALGVAATLGAQGSGVSRSTAAIFRQMYTVNCAAGILTGDNTKFTGTDCLTPATDDALLVSSGAAWQKKALTDCTGTNKAVTYTASTNTFGCNTVTVGTGDITASGTMTTDAIIIGGGTTVVSASSCSIDGSGNLSCPGLITGGTGSGAAGEVSLVQGTIPGSFSANSFSLYAPTSIGTAYQWRVPAADAAGLIQSDGAGTPGVLSIVAPTDDTVPVGNGTSYAPKAIPNCPDSGGNHLNYTASTNTFSCGTS